MVIVIVGLPIISVIIGAVLGFLFVVFQKKLPGSTIIRKSVAFSLILLAIDFLIGISSFFVPNRTGTLSEVAVAKLYSLRLVSYGEILVEFPLLGYLFGYLLSRRLAHQKKTPEA